MIAYVLMLASATPTTAIKSPPIESAKICPDGTEVLQSNTCEAPQTESTMIGISLKARPAKAKNYPGSWVTTNDYPSRALSLMQEGLTSFRLTVGKDGRATTCQITESSGVPELDMATCTNAVWRARFDPALDADGNPIEGAYSNRVMWRIPSFGSIASATLLEDCFPHPPRLPNNRPVNLLESDYPAVALAAAKQGLVMVMVDVSKSGTVTGCKVLAGSGFNALDEKSCALAKGWKYEPALDFAGKATIGKSKHAFSWRLPPPNEVSVDGTALDAQSGASLRRRARYGVNEFTPGSLTVNFIAKADGTVSDCKVEQSGNPMGISSAPPPCDGILRTFRQSIEQQGELRIDRTVRLHFSVDVDPPFPVQTKMEIERPSADASTLSLVDAAEGAAGPPPQK